MADKKYKYFGPLSSVTLAADVDHPNGRNVQLARGLVVSLPEDNAYVISLVARRYLVPVEDKTTSTASQTPSAATEETPSAENTAAASTTSAQTATATSAATPTSASSTPTAAATSTTTASTAGGTTTTGA